MPFANINGARLFYTDEGSGPAIVLAHGTTCDSNDWNMQLPAFESDFRVISVDLRGHGESTHDIFRDSFVDFYAETSPRYLRLWHARRLQGVEPWVLRACYRDTVLAEDQIFFRPEAERFLGRVPCPVFTLRRTGSSIAPSSADWDCSLFSHPYSTGISWSGAGHWPHQERPEEFNVAVTSWIRGLPAPGFTSP